MGWDWGAVAGGQQRGGSGGGDGYRVCSLDLGDFVGIGIARSDGSARWWARQMNAWAGFSGSADPADSPIAGSSGVYCFLGVLLPGCTGSWVY